MHSCLQLSVCRWVFEDDPVQYEIKTSQGAIVYDDRHLKNKLAKIWRDMLLSLIAQGKQDCDKLASVIINSLKKEITKTQYGRDTVAVDKVKEFVRTPKGELHTPLSLSLLDA